MLVAPTRMVGLMAIMNLAEQQIELPSDLDEGATQAQ
jgi:hypothetical protein